MKITRKNQKNEKLKRDNKERRRKVNEEANLFYDDNVVSEYGFSHVVAIGNVRYTAGMLVQFLGTQVNLKGCLKQEIYE
jgi:hypothetical protein